MNKEQEYLSQEELELLIAETESEEWLDPPPGLREDIISRILESTEQAGKTEKETRIKFRQKGRTTEYSKEGRTAGHRKEDRTAEYYRYCIRVTASVAAAVFLIFTMPWVTETEQWRKMTDENPIDRNLEELESRRLGNLLDGIFGNLAAEPRSDVIFRRALASNIIFGGSDQRSIFSERGE